MSVLRIFLIYFLINKLYILQLSLEKEKLSVDVNLISATRALTQLMFIAQVARCIVIYFEWLTAEVVLPITA